MHRTPIVKELWDRRARSKLRSEDLLKSGAFNDRPIERVLTPKPPEASTASIVYEFSNPEKVSMTDKYRNPWGKLRFGRLLEDLDALAGTIAFEHVRCEDPRVKDLAMVTASVDRIRYAADRPRPDLTRNVTMTGSVTWVGRSSLEILMKAFTECSSEPFLESYFTFVARDPDTNRAAQINPLKVEGSEGLLLFHIGRQRDWARKMARKAAKRSGGLPDEDVENMARGLFHDAQPLLAMPSLAKDAVLISETRLQNTLPTMPQHRNLAGKIFGGFLMRRAFELAHATAHTFAGRRPIFLEVSEISFLAPVNTGDLLQLKSSVLYTSDKMDLDERLTMHLEVVATILKPDCIQTVLSNAFYFTFGVSECANGDGGPARKGSDFKLRPVLPDSMSSARRIAKRYFDDLQQLEEDKLGM